jgi:hypothetical protein
MIPGAEAGYVWPGDTVLSVAREVAPGHDQAVRRNRPHDQDQVRAGGAAGRECGLDAAEADPRRAVTAPSRRAAQAAAGDRVGLDADRASGRLDSQAGDVPEHRVGSARRAGPERASAWARRHGRGVRFTGAGRRGGPSRGVRGTGVAARARAERRGKEQGGKQRRLHRIATILSPHPRSAPVAADERPAGPPVRRPHSPSIAALGIRWPKRPARSAAPGQRTNTPLSPRPSHAARSRGRRCSSRLPGALERLRAEECRLPRVGLQWRKHGHPVRRGADHSDGRVSATRGRGRSARRSRGSRTSWSRSGPAGRLR